MNDPGKTELCNPLYSYNNIIDDIIFFLLYFILIIDSINGYFLNFDAHLPLSQLHKSVLTFFIFIRLLTFLKSRIILVIVIYLYLLSFSLYFILFRDYEELFLETITHLMKFILVVIAFFYFKKVLQIDSRTFYKKILLVFKINFYVLCFNLLSKFVGLGFASYGDSEFGSRGFFYATNELSGVIIVFASFYIFYFSYYLQNLKFKKIVFFIFLFYLALATATKTSIFSVLVSLLIIPFIVRKQKGLYHINFKKIFIYSLFLIGLLYSIFGAIQKTGISERWIYFYDKKGIIFALTSGRFEYVENKIFDYIDSDILGYFWGLGGNRTVEMDFFDVLLNYGIIGVTLFYSFFVYLFVIANKNRKKGIFPYASLVMFVDILLAFISFFAGHIIFSAMAGVFISLLNSLAFYKEDTLDSVNLNKLSVKSHHVVQSGANN